MKRILTLFAALAAILALAGCARQAETKQQQQVAAQTIRANTSLDYDGDPDVLILDDRVVHTIEDERGATVYEYRFNGDYLIAITVRHQSSVAMDTVKLRALVEDSGYRINVLEPYYMEAYAPEDVLEQWRRLCQTKELLAGTLISPNTNALT